MNLSQHPAWIIVNKLEKLILMLLFIEYKYIYIYSSLKT